MLSIDCVFWRERSGPPSPPRSHSGNFALLSLCSFSLSLFIQASSSSVLSSLGAKSDGEDDDERNSPSLSLSVPLSLFSACLFAHFPPRSSLLFRFISDCLVAMNQQQKMMKEAAFSLLLSSLLLSVCWPLLFLLYLPCR